MSGLHEGGNAQILMAGGRDGGDEVGDDTWFTRRAVASLAWIFSNREAVRWQIPTPILPRVEFQAQKRLRFRVTL